MSNELPTELFGVPGTPGEWLSPDGELAALKRIDEIEQYPICDDTRYLAQLARKLIEARIATRSAIAKMAADLAGYEQGQGILGAVTKANRPTGPWQTEAPTAEGYYWRRYESTDRGGICLCYKVERLRPSPDRTKLVNPAGNDVAEWRDCEWSGPIHPPQ